MRILTALTVSKALQTQRLAAAIRRLSCHCEFTGGREQRRNGSLRGMRRPDGIRILRAKRNKSRTLATSSRQLEQLESPHATRRRKPFATGHALQRNAKILFGLLR